MNTPLQIEKSHIGIIGASSFIGGVLIEQLLQQGHSVMAFTRKPVTEQPSVQSGVIWQSLSGNPSLPEAAPSPTIPLWICVAPIKALSDHFGILDRYGAQRIVALSSTSLFTKGSSPDPAERVYVQKLAECEEALHKWCAAHQAHWVVIRPTLVYGRGQDRNVSAIARFIERFGFFPLLGGAQGLRQPVHVEDVAQACTHSLLSPSISNKAYIVSGAEVLTYRDMVSRIFRALGKPARCINVPLWAFHIAVAVIRQIPRYHDFSAAMAVRMNTDMVFGYEEAKKDLGYTPRRFGPKKNDILNP